MTMKESGLEAGRFFFLIDYRTAETWLFSPPGSTTPIFPFIHSVNQTRPLLSSPMNREAALLDGIGNSANRAVFGSNRVMWLPFKSANQMLPLFLSAATP